MKLLKKIFTCMLILLAFNLFLPTIAFAEHRYLYAKKGITEHEPEILSTPEEEIPTVKVKKSSSWAWMILLALIAGGAAAAAAGGGEETSTPPTPPPSGDTGDVTVTW
ncbi:MAG: hypothetical protein JRF35_14270 [Deltaproteobacteria bacterium]|nr:hypothetical protein [Deltaproteobacteria bacterium]